MITKKRVNGVNNTTIRTLMAQNNYTATKLADVLQVEVSTISLKLSGKTPWFENEIIKISTMFNVEPSILLVSPDQLELKRKTYE